MVNEIIFRTIAGFGLWKEYSESARNLSNLRRDIMFSQKHRELRKGILPRKKSRKRGKKKKEEKLYLFWSAGKTDQSRMPVFQVILLKNKRGDILKNWNRRGQRRTSLELLRSVADGVDADEKWLDQLWSNLSHEWAWVITAAFKGLIHSEHCTFWSTMSRASAICKKNCVEKNQNKIEKFGRQTFRNKAKIKPFEARWGIYQGNTWSQNIWAWTGLGTAGFEPGAYASQRLYSQTAQERGEG